MARKLLFLLPALMLIVASCQKEPADGGRLEITSSVTEEDGRSKIFLRKEIVCRGICTDQLQGVKIKPPPATQPCTMIYGGPEKISLEGKVGGNKIAADFNLSGGCEIERFDSALLFIEKQGISRQELFPEILAP